MINTLLLFAVAEFLLYPFSDSAIDVVFTRVGAIYPDSVKIVMRYPKVNATQNAVKVLWREDKGHADLEVGWMDGPILPLTDDADWVGTVNLGELWPSTKYECQRSLPSHLDKINPLGRYSGFAQQVHPSISPKAHILPNLPRPST